MDAVDAEHVRDLVRVGDDRRRPEREDQPGELVDHQLHRLDVHVRIDEPGNDVAASGVDRLAPLVGAEPRDHAVDDRDIDVEPLAREHAQHAASAHDEVGRLVATGNGKAAGEVSHGRQPNARREVDRRYVEFLEPVVRTLLRSPSTATSSTGSTCCCAGST